MSILALILLTQCVSEKLQVLSLDSKVSWDNSIDLRLKSCFDNEIYEKESVAAINKNIELYSCRSFILNYFKGFKFRSSILIEEEIHSVKNNEKKFNFHYTAKVQFREKKDTSCVLFILKNGKWTIDTEQLFSDFLFKVKDNCILYKQNLYKVYIEYLTEISFNDKKEKFSTKRIILNQYLLKPASQ